MITELTLGQVDGLIRVTLPSDMAEHLHRRAGDRVLAVETERGILLTPCDPVVSAGWATAAEASVRFRKALRDLAK